MDADVLLTQLYRVDTTDNATMRTGIVRRLDAIKGVIDVEVAGELLRDIPYGGGLSPVVGESVWLIEQGNWFAAISASASTGQFSGIDEVVVGDVPPTQSSVDFWMDTNNVGEGDGWDVLDERYVNAEGDTMTGDLLVDKPLGHAYVISRSSDPAGDAFLRAASAPGRNAGFDLASDDEVRWRFYKNATAESGANVGSDLYLGRHDDNGVWIGTTFWVSRATNVLTFAAQPAVNSPSANIGLSAGWAIQSGYGAKVTRWGPLVCLEATLSRTGANVDITNWTTVGSVPAAFLDDVGVGGAGNINGSVPTGTYVSSGGTLQIRSSSTVTTTVNTGWFININLTWRVT